VVRATSAVLTSEYVRQAREAKGEGGTSKGGDRELGEVGRENDGSLLGMTERRCSDTLVDDGQSVYNKVDRKSRKVECGGTKSWEEKDWEKNECSPLQRYLNRLGCYDRTQDHQLRPPPPHGIPTTLPRPSAASHSLLMGRSTDGRHRDGLLKPPPGEVEMMARARRCIRRGAATVNPCAGRKSVKTAEEKQDTTKKPLALKRATEISREQRAVSDRTMPPRR
jgi:hypothetical protein